MQLRMTVGSVRPPRSCSAASLRLGLSLAMVLALTWRDWIAMTWQWWNADSYSHILLIPFILAWLVWLRRDVVMQEPPRGSGAGLGLLLLALTLWIAGRGLGINLLAQAGAVGAAQSVVVAVLGVRIALLLALPIGFAVFLVPFGDEIIAPMQMVTAHIVIALLQMFGIPASIEGLYIETPAGLFVVAEACAGVRFLIAMIALGVLAAFTAFSSWRQRLPFVVACVAVPILANGVRAFATIGIAQEIGAEAAGGVDHIVYGWFFFAFVIALVLGAAWRWFDRTPDEAGYSRAELDRSSMVKQIERWNIPDHLAFGSIIVMIGLAATLAAVAGLR